MSSLEIVKWGFWRKLPLLWPANAVDEKLAIPYLLFHQRLVALVYTIWFL